MLLLRNLIIHRHPLYGLGAWARSMLPELVGFSERELDQLNDDRIGRALDRLFDADRLALLTELVFHMVQTFEVDAILAKTQTTAYITYRVTSEQEIKYHTVQQGELTRKYRRGSKTRFHLQWETDSSALRDLSKSDGVFPLITNCRDLFASEVFNAYRSKQPVVEQRHDLLKNILEATPAYLKNIGRLEALLFLEFIALMVHALIERQMRHAMETDRIKGVPLYPEDRSCKAPTTTRLIHLFQPVQCHRLKDGDVLVQEFPPELSDLQKTMTRLVGAGPGMYTNIRMSGKMAN